MHNVVQPIAIKTNALGSKIWRDLARLAAESLVIGLAFSVLLALAVLLVARSANNDIAHRADSASAAARMA